ncbi:hypothetical protein [Streptomyces globisporus]|uniref:Uncharacterized protein n=1 Tax=Streptomyces globisporus TaxID=1908 RepID=A0A423UQ17_STRGL|nr:hypothetical protein [Streptomyces globisporus]ROV64421.1 hypothetical protein D3105_32915 [Streptomyces globisporus]
MAIDRLTEAYRCGQLYAALAALERLCGGTHHPLDDPAKRRQVSTEPRKHLAPHLWKATRSLVDATNQGRGKAAAVVFRQLPDLLPLRRELPGEIRVPLRRELPGEIRDAAERARFQEGVTAQEAAIGKALAEL